MIICFECFTYLNIIKLINAYANCLKSFYKFILNKNNNKYEFENELILHIKSILISSFKILLFFVPLIFIVLIFNYYSKSFVQFIFSFQSTFKMIIIYFIYNFLRNKI